jgi:hypothetical protein
MRNRHAFVPSAFSLEKRLVLSQVAIAQHAVSAAVAHRTDGAPHSGHGVRGAILRSFNRFRADYSEALANYIEQNNNPDGQAAFENFTQQRVYQLSQQLGSSLSQVAVKTEKGGQSFTSLRIFLHNRILAAKSTQSLQGGLNSAVPPVGTTGDGSKIFAQVAMSATGAAQTAAITAVTTLSNGSYTGSKHIYKH